MEAIYKNNDINTLNLYDIHYTAHIINLVVKDILKEYLLYTVAEAELSNYINNFTDNTNKIKGLTNKIRRISTLIKYTREGQQLFNEGLEKYKKSGQIPTTYNKKIPLDNTTRWNSTYNMIKTALKLKEVIIYILNLTTNTEFKNYILTITD